MINYKIWTLEEEKELERLLNEGLSHSAIGIKLDRTPVSCKSHSSKLKIKCKYLSGKKYTQDEDFWAIPNLINSYWAGFSAADASIQVRNKKNFTYKLEIQQSDMEHLQKLASDSKFMGKILLSKRPERNSTTVRICVNSTKWAEDLKNNFNIIPNKTRRLEPPNDLSKENLLSWLIGYIDGDGTIHYNKTTNQININFVSSSENLIKFIHYFINSNFPQRLINKDNNYYKNKKYNCWYISLSGIKVCVIIDYLRSFPVPKLARKWENPQVLSYISQKKQEFPHLFLPPYPNLV
jgi:hypothetical protein